MRRSPAIVPQFPEAAGRHDQTEAPAASNPTVRMGTQLGDVKRPIPPTYAHIFFGAIAARQLNAHAPQP
jgi:hypothetical protein